VPGFQEATDLIESGLAEEVRMELMFDDLQVNYGDLVTGKITWKNTGLMKGSPVSLLFLLRKNGQYYSFTQLGEQWLVGSIVDAIAGDIGTPMVNGIPSRAMFPGVWDAEASAGVTSGAIRTVLETNGRVIALHAGDLASYLSSYSSEQFSGALTVIGANLSGKVRDDTSLSALSGVGVTAVAPDGSTATTTTDQNGNYSLKDLIPGPSGITFRKDGYQEKYVEQTLNPGNNTLNVALTALQALPANVYLTVTDAITAAPMYYASVTLDSKSGKTTQQGRIDFLDLAPKTYTLTVKKIGYTDWQETVTLGAGESRWIYAELVPTVNNRAAGLVLDFWDEPSELHWYEDFTVSAKVRNVGGKAGTIYVNMKHAPTGTHTWYSWHMRSIYLDPGQEGTVSATSWSLSPEWGTGVFDGYAECSPMSAPLGYTGPFDSQVTFLKKLTVLAGLPMAEAQGRIVGVSATPQPLHRVDREWCEPFTLTVEVQNILVGYVGDHLVVFSDIPGLVGGRVLGTDLYWQPQEVKTYSATWDNIYATRGPGVYTGRVWVQHESGEPVQDEKTFIVEVV
jgi:hypothetical protein